MDRRKPKPPDPIAEQRRADSWNRDTPPGSPHTDAATKPVVALTSEQVAPLTPEEWIARWPNYCQKCDGYGMTSWTEFVPYGMGSAGMPMSEPCECVGDGKCPRCGQLGLTSEDRGGEETGNGPCRFCEWNYDDGLPQVFYDEGE
jgi:hypothetical protein